MQWSLRCSVLLLRNLCAAADGCWAECGRSGYYCPEFCCQPTDGGNPSCWDEAGIYTFSKCCTQVTFGPDVDLYFQLGQVLLPLYRGPSEHNSPKVNERTLEVALGLWYMRRSLREGTVPIEIGNVLSNYWPKDDYLQATSADSSAMLRYLPWHLADLEYGQDATTLSFQDTWVLSISTVEHVGHDNEGLGGSVNGFRSDGSLQSLEDWVRSWNQAPELLQRIFSAQSFLVTFPIGLNVRLDDVVSSNAWLRNHSRIVRRVNAQNLWQVDPDFPKNPSAFHKYHYDLRDAYWPDTIGLMFHPQLPAVYEQIYGHPMRPRLRPPQHPRFRFANAVCVVTNVPELLA